MPHSILPLHTLPTRAGAFAAYRLAAFGERRGYDWLTYNPVQMWAYHRLALRDARGVTAAVFEIFPGVQSVADVGAGSGAFAAAAQRHGRLVKACEYTRTGRLYARAQGVHAVPFDLQRTPPARLTPGVDLAYCFEVAEHCPAETSESLVRFLVSLAPFVIFTAAPPGQGGLGHINEREHSYWIRTFRDHGAEPLPDLTDRLRHAMQKHNVTADWFTQNINIFGATDRRRAAPVDLPEARRA